MIMSTTHKKTLAQNQMKKSKINRKKPPAFSFVLANNRIFTIEN